MEPGCGAGSTGYQLVRQASGRWSGLAGEGRMQQICTDGQL